VRGGRGKTDARVYDNLYKKWAPEKFDAAQWVILAKEAGMKYMIFLVKHHDGFCLYDTKLTDYKSTGPESAWKVDVMKHVADACHKHGIKLMIYYSQPDWHHPDYLGENHDRYIKYLHGQIRELLTHYGQIDGLWFDNLRPVHQDSAKLWHAEKLFRMARSIQPNLIINNRCGLPGDFDTPEQSIRGFEFDRPWESCVTLGTQWSWKPDDSIKTLKECIDILVTCAGRGGNLALNTNPMPDGRIEGRQARRFLQIGRWLSKYGESIYATRGGPYVMKTWGTRFKDTNRSSDPSQRTWGVTTWKGRNLYVHVLNFNRQVLELPAIDRKLISYRTLTGGDAKVAQTEEVLTISVAAEDRDSLDTIIELRFDRSLEGIVPIFAGKKSLAFGCEAKASSIWQEPKLDAALAFDGDTSTRWGGAPNSKAGWLIVDLAKPRTFSRAWISEAYNRIQKFEFQQKKNGKWRTFHTGTTVGQDFNAAFEPITAQFVRLNILTATDVPTIWEVQLFAE
jgi:alpha-L-fucosidase